MPHTRVSLISIYSFYSLGCKYDSQASYMQNGTLTNEISKAVKEAKVESINFKKDKTAIVHVGLGKV